MRLSELLSRLMNWRKVHDEQPLPLEEAQRQYTQICERELRKRVGVLQLRSAFLSDELKRLGKEKAEVDQELDALQQSERALPAPAVPASINTDHTDQQVAIQEAKQKMADLLGALQRSEQPQQQVYNLTLLDQESDELLHYL